MNHLEKIKASVAICLAASYGLTAPYIYFKYTKYNFIRFLVLLVITLFMLAKLSKEIKIKQYDLSYIIMRVLQISGFIGAVLGYAIVKLNFIYHIT